MKNLKCYFCQRPIRTIDSGFIEFYDAEKAGKGLTYPGNGPGMDSWGGYEPIWLFSHTGCGPDVGYAIALTELRTRKQVYHWLNHLSQKTTVFASDMLYSLPELLNAL